MLEKILGQVCQTPTVCDHLSTISLASKVVFSFHLTAAKPEAGLTQSQEPPPDTSLVDPVKEPPLLPLATGPSPPQPLTLGLTSCSQVTIKDPKVET